MYIYIYVIQIHIVVNNISYQLYNANLKFLHHISKNYYNSMYLLRNFFWTKFKQKLQKCNKANLKLLNIQYRFLRIFVICNFYFNF